MPDEVPTTRGSLQFQITPAGDLQNPRPTCGCSRQLWADRTLIRGDDLGPGDPGDFDHGAWHSSCHLLGAGGARRATDGRVLWLEVSHARARDEYFASVTFRDSGKPQTVPLDSAEGRDAGRAIALLLGSWRGTRPAGHRRAMSSMRPTGSISGGGRISTSRSPRSSKAGRSGSTGVRSATCGRPTGLGCRRSRPTCRSSRRWEIGSAPRSRAAGAITATRSNSARWSTPGFVGKDSATWNATPTPIPAAWNRCSWTPNPSEALAAVEQLDWEKPPKYFMFERRIKSWSTAAHGEGRSEEVRRRPQAGLIRPALPEER